jgi:O-antigen/teichoic acid export membrane protein
MMDVRRVYARGLSLLSLSFVDFGTPFVRMIILARFLNLRELGFASALVATYATFEQITDIAMYRFVLSSPREDYEDALAAAHALSFLRGCIVGTLALLAAPMAAYLLSLSSNWTSFAWLALIFFIRSFEHLAPKVAERDYHYGAQFKVSFIANLLGLLALVATAMYSHDHSALLASLIAMATGTVVASHVLAGHRYRIKFRSPFFKKAWNYGYPLMFNGFGLSLTGQGDRLVVGALLGLPVLGVYSVVLLVSVIPTSMLFKIMGTINFAAFRNASVATGQFQARLRLYARCVPLIAACYMLGLLALFNIAVPMAFGRQFEVSNWDLTLLSTGAFFKIVRTEPFTSLLFHEMKTKTLAMATQSTIFGLLIGTTLTYFYRSLESMLIGRLVGEMIGLCFTLCLTVKSFRAALWDYLLSLTVALTVVLLASSTMSMSSIGERPVLNFGVMSVFGFSILAWASVALPDLFHQGYGSRRQVLPPKSA